MNPLEVIAIAERLFAIYSETKAALISIKNNDPVAYAEAERLHHAAGKHLDDATR